MKPLYYLLIYSVSLLSACSKEYTGLETVDPKSFLASLDGPDVPTVDKSLLKSAADMEDAGNYTAAAQIYTQLMEKNSSSSAYAYKLAEALRRSGQPDKALDLYEGVIARNKNSADAIEGKALALMAKGNMDGAGESLAQVQELLPGRWRTLNAIGILFAARGMHEDAQYYFSNALEKSPGNVSLLNNIGLEYAMQRDFSTAISSLQEAAAKAGSNNSNRRTVDLNLALVYGAADRLNDAETLAKKYYSGAALSNNMGLYAHVAQDDALAKTYFNEALVQSKTYYERAWKNLDVVNSTPTPNGADKTASAGKRIIVENTGTQQQHQPSWVDTLRAPQGAVASMPVMVAKPQADNPIASETAKAAPVMPVKEGFFSGIFGGKSKAETKVDAKPQEQVADYSKKSSLEQPEVLATSDSLKPEKSVSAPITDSPFGSEDVVVAKPVAQEKPVVETVIKEETKPVESEKMAVVEEKKTEKPSDPNAPQTSNGFQALSRWLTDAVE